MIYLSVYHCICLYKASCTYYKGSSLTEVGYGYYCFLLEENSKQHEISIVDVN